MPANPPGRLVPAHDTHLYVVERGAGDGFPLLVPNTGPGQREPLFTDQLDALGDRYRLVLVDLRAEGHSDADSDPASWTLAQHASDISAIAAALGQERYAVLGHDFGAFVALQHAVDGPGAAVATIVSGGGLADDLEGDIARVSQPLLACTGSDDRTCPPAVAERIAALAPLGELHVFAGSGHDPFVDAGEDYVRVVREFLERATT